MVGNNIMKKVKYNSEVEQSNLNPRIVCDDPLEKLLDWPSLDSKYTESEIMNHILENDNIEIRKNRDLIDYLEVLFKPKMFKEYFLITKSNFIFVDYGEFDRLFNSLLISMPVKVKDNEAENKVSDIKAVINKIYNTHPTIIENDDLAIEDIYEKNLAQLLKEPTVKKEHFSLENIKIVNFLIKCVNPILINGVLEIMKNTPKDPIDFLVEYIYKHNDNMYNPCVSSPPSNKKPKVANSLNKHLL
ncbi:PREDICTED: adenylate kinase 7-like [Diuraphis noxia]|uniref:adenylate kinase 7-like n=1 Tax=Diuraphis noxia TaxID=143948 RepID=UPI0007637862|nr:PREDICTED: adenylate kinase 7-like [Diuraphis noxia]